MTCLYKTDFDTKKPKIVIKDDQYEDAIIVTVCLVLGLVVLAIALMSGGLR